MQKLSAVIGEMVFHHGRQYFRVPKPPAETNELRQLFIVHFCPRLLNAVLSPIQFLPHICPIALVCRIDERLGVWGGCSFFSRPLSAGPEARGQILFFMP